MKAFTNKRLIGASPEAVFDAIQDPGKLARWWGPKGFSCSFQTFQFEPGGKWVFVMRGPDGSEFSNENSFSEIDKPGKVVVRHDALPFFTVTLTMKAIGDSTEIVWVQAFDDESVADSIAHIIEPANKEVLDKLQALVEAR